MRLIHARRRGASSWAAALALVALSAATTATAQPVDGVSEEAAPAIPDHLVAPAPAVCAPLSLDCRRAGERVAELVGIEQPLDAHLTALAVAALCPGDLVSQWRLWDAVALTRLEEFSRARAILDTVTLDPELGRSARIISAWSVLRSGDDRAFRSAVAALDREPATRLAILHAVHADEPVSTLAQELDAQLATAVQSNYRAYRHARSKRPWLAGTLSALLPGLGQAYGGSWQGAAVAFTINAILIGGTVELGRNQLYFASATTGLAASVFYVGNILNAADLARRYNDRASEASIHQLERLLVPEVFPGR